MLRYSILTKFLAIVLCAVCLVVCVAGAAGIIINEDNGLYTHGLEGWLESEASMEGYRIAHSAVALHAAEHFGNCTDDVLRALKKEYYTPSIDEQYWSMSIYLGEEQIQQGDYLEGAWNLAYEITPYYPALWNKEDDPEQYYESFRVTNEYNSNEFYHVDLTYKEGPTYHVALYLLPQALDSFQVGFMTMIYNLRYHFIAMLVAGLLLFAATLVLLCCAAGRRPNSDRVYPVALNRLPLDLYAAIIAAAEVGLSYLVIEMLEACFDYGGNWAVASLIALGIFAMALLVVAFIFAFAAQMKTKGGFWWRRTVIGWLLVRLLRGIKAMCRGFRALIGMLPLVWQWLLIIVGVLLTAMLSLIVLTNSYGIIQILATLVFLMSVLGFFGMIAYWGYCMGHLLKGITTMAAGNLHYQIPTTRLYGKFRDFGTSLNSMADAARISAQRQLKSERMKTELITNVSHDIKTPLTSIINYVDLLQKPHDDAQGEQYLEVLSRQSHRLKKLIDDLMDLSKASTGNINVELGYVDAVEAINQALGEFSDRLDRAALVPVFQRPDEPVVILADGKLLWRVMSNLLSNAVKYAMPGTRIYIDLVTSEGNAVLHMKNISRDQLNINADELLERFVRGDTARNTEGSGLGLNIAKNLVELQKGQIQLMVDGDLFKVTIIFPLAQE